MSGLILVVGCVADNLDYLPRLQEFVSTAPAPVLILATQYNHTEKRAAHLGDMVFSWGARTIWKCAASSYKYYQPITYNSKSSENLVFSEGFSS